RPLRGRGAGGAHRRGRDHAVGRGARARRRRARGGGRDRHRRGVEHGREVRPGGGGRLARAAPARGGGDRRAARGRRRGARADGVGAAHQPRRSISQRSRTVSPATRCSASWYATVGSTCAGQTRTRSPTFGRSGPPGASGSGAKVTCSSEQNHTFAPSIVGLPWSMPSDLSPASHTAHAGPTDTTVLSTQKAGRNGRPSFA